jgi:hypothetical protein
MMEREGRMSHKSVKDKMMIEKKGKLDTGNTLTHPTAFEATTFSTNTIQLPVQTTK